jgi:DNA polymerase
MPSSTAASWVPPDADLPALRAAAANCRGCELWEPATQVVFSGGSDVARLMLVGEQPGDVEDREGVPFVGPAGRLLQRAVDDAGIARNDLYVTNAVKHFRFTLRGKRRIHQTPQVSHIVACQPWLEAEILRVDPSLVVVLGATAARSVLGAGFRVSKQRGQVIEAEPPVGPRRVLATMHPSAVLRMRGEEHEQAYADLVADLRVAAEAIRAD